MARYYHCFILFFVFIGLVSGSLPVTLRVQPSTPKNVITVMDFSDGKTEDSNPSFFLQQKTAAVPTVMYHTFADQSFWFTRIYPNNTITNHRLNITNCKLFPTTSHVYVPNHWSYEHSSLPFSSPQCTTDPFSPHH